MPNFMLIFYFLEFYVGEFLQEIVEVAQFLFRWTILINVLHKSVNTSLALLSAQVLRLEDRCDSSEGLGFWFFGRLSYRVCLDLQSSF